MDSSTCLHRGSLAPLVVLACHVTSAATGSGTSQNESSECVLDTKHHANLIAPRARIRPSLPTIYRNGQRSTVRDVARRSVHGSPLREGIRASRGKEPRLVCTVAIAQMEGFRIDAEGSSDRMRCPQVIQIATRRAAAFVIPAQPCPTNLRLAEMEVSIQRKTVVAAGTAGETAKCARPAAQRIVCRGYAPARSAVHQQCRPFPARLLVQPDSHRHSRYQPDSVLRSPHRGRGCSWRRLSYRRTCPCRSLRCPHACRGYSCRVTRTRRCWGQAYLPRAWTRTTWCTDDPHQSAPSHQRCRPWPGVRRAALPGSQYHCPAQIRIQARTPPCCRVRDPRYRASPNAKVPFRSGSA